MPARAGWPNPPEDAAVLKHPLVLAALHGGRSWRRDAWNAAAAVQALGKSPRRSSGRHAFDGGRRSAMTLIFLAPEEEQPLLVLLKPK
jgi:hypothetical protein